MKDVEYEKLACLAKNLRKAVASATTVKQISIIVADAKTKAGRSDWAYILYPAVFAWAVKQAHIVDPKSKLTAKLEDDWKVATAKAGMPVTRAAILHARQEARMWKVFRPLAKRHHSLCSQASTPSDLLPILADLAKNAPSEWDTRFKVEALCEAYRVAWRLDPSDITTVKIGEELDRLTGKGFAKALEGVFKFDV